MKYGKITCVYLDKTWAAGATITKAISSEGRFLILFVSLNCLFFFAGVRLLPDFFLTGFLNLTGNLVASFSRVLNITAFYEQGFVTVAGFRMLLNLECTAIHFIGIYFSAVLAYPRHDFSYKIKGLLAGGVFIVLINAFRIVVLGLIGANSVRVFNFTHVYLWQGLFAIIIFFAWFIWVRRVLMSWPFLRFCSICLIASAAAILALGYVMEPYLRVLSFISEKFTGLLPLPDKLSLAVIKDEIQIQYSGALFLFPVSVDVFDSAIFFALMAASLTTENARGLAKGILQGAVILAAVHLLFILAAGGLAIYKIQGRAMQDIMWLMRAMSIMTPVLLWACMKDRFKQGALN